MTTRLKNSLPDLKDLSYYVMFTWIAVLIILSFTLLFYLNYTYLPKNKQKNYYFQLNHKQNSLNNIDIVQETLRVPLVFRLMTSFSELVFFLCHYFFLSVFDGLFMFLHSFTVIIQDE